ncbi:7840_t:CDS:2, partial [Gigaspora rosea]
MEILDNNVDQILFEVANFIDELKDYDDLFVPMNVDCKKANEAWNNAINSINLLGEKSFSSRHQLIEFMILAIHDVGFLNTNEIIYLLDRLQNADDNLLAKRSNIYNVDFIWNTVVKIFSKEAFSTDQQVLEFFIQFTSGITNFNFFENSFFLARLQLVFTLCSIRQSQALQEAFSDQPIYVKNIDKKKINSIWNNICTKFSKEIFSSIQQVSGFFNQFINGIVDLNEAENALFLARLRFASIICVNFQSFTSHQEILFLSQQIYNDKSLREEEKVYLHNYLQIDYKNDFKDSVFKRANDHFLRLLWNVDTLIIKWNADDKSSFLNVDSNGLGVYSIAITDNDIDDNRVKEEWIKAFKQCDYKDIIEEELMKLAREEDARLKNAETKASKVSDILQILKGIAERKKRARFFLSGLDLKKLPWEDMGKLVVACVLSTKKKNIWLELLKKEKNFELNTTEVLANAIILSTQFIRELRKSTKKEVDIVEEFVTKQELEKLVKEAEKKEEDEEGEITYAEISKALEHLAKDSLSTTSTITFSRKRKREPSISIDSVENSD